MKGIPCIFLCAMAFGLCFSCVHSGRKEDRSMESSHPHSKGPGGPVTVVTPDKTRLYEFHGHLGPYVILGFRASKVARQKLQSPGYFDLTCQVTCPLKPPASCFIDGIQVGSGCTLGKGNLRVKEGKSISCVFETKSGRSLKITLQPNLPSVIKKWIEEEGVEEAGKKAWKVPVEEVFSVEMKE